MFHLLVSLVSLSDRPQETTSPGFRFASGPLPPSSGGEPRSVRQLVLIIDDDRMVCESMIEVLDLEGMSAVAAFSGEFGVEIFRQRQEEIGLVILDLSMPGMDGLATLEALQALDPSVPVVLASGYGRETALAQFGDKGLVGFVQKPFDIMAFADMVRSLL